MDYLGFIYNMEDHITAYIILCKKVNVRKTQFENVCYMKENSISMNRDFVQLKLKFHLNIFDSFSNL